MPKFDISIGLTIDAETQDDARGIAFGACEHLQDTFNDDGSIDRFVWIENGAPIRNASQVRAALAALLDWGRSHTSPRDANSPHALLIAAAAALEGAPATQSDTARIDPDTGRPVVYPAHCIIRGACYWLEPLNGGAPFLMSCPVSPGGAIDWGDVAEVGPDECAGYAEIMATLTPSR